MRTMQIDEFGDYLMVGLRSVSGIGPAQPAYKTLMGKEVQAAVRPSDKSFHRGTHCCGPAVRDSRHRYSR